MAFNFNMMIQSKGLICWFFADDTLVISDNCTDLQTSLDHFAECCNNWQLKFNLSKANVIVFCARHTNRYNCTLHGSMHEITNKYKYLGIYFISNGSVATVRKLLYDQANKHMLYTRICNFNLPIDLH